MKNGGSLLVKYRSGSPIHHASSCWRDFSFRIFSPYFFLLSSIFIFFLLTIICYRSLNNWHFDADSLGNTKDHHLAPSYPGIRPVEEGCCVMQQHRPRMLCWLIYISGRISITILSVDSSARRQNKNAAMFKDKKSQSHANWKIVEFFKWKENIIILELVDWIRCSITEYVERFPHVITVIYRRTPPCLWVPQHSNLVLGKPSFTNYQLKGLSI